MFHLIQLVCRVCNSSHAWLRSVSCSAFTLLLLLTYTDVCAVYIYIYIFLSLDERQWLAPVIIGTCVVLTPVWGWVAAKNKYTKEVLDSGWTPVISAMLISRLMWLQYSYM
jgi:4-hydroxybenzoate polyprenyltransferase